MSSANRFFASAASFELGLIFTACLELLQRQVQLTGFRLSHPEVTVHSGVSGKSSPGSHSRSVLIERLKVRLGGFVDLLYPKTHGIFLHCFVSGLDRPIGSWLPLGHQQSAGQEKLGKDGRHSHGYLSVDNLHSTDALERDRMPIVLEDVHTLSFLRSLKGLLESEC